MIRNIEFLTKWVADLRSGKHKQTKCCLRRQIDGEFKYCCLGRAYDIQYPNCWEPNWNVNGDANNLFINQGEIYYLSTKFREFIGLSESEVIELAKLNDTYKYSFEQIADYIEEKFIK